MQFSGRTRAIVRDRRFLLIVLAPLACAVTDRAMSPNPDAIRDRASAIFLFPNGYKTDTLTVGDTVTPSVSIPPKSRTCCGHVSRNPSIATVNTTTGKITAQAVGTTFVVDSQTVSPFKKDSGQIVVMPTTPTPPACTVVKDWGSRSKSTFAKPSYLSYSTEPDFGTKIIRISGNVGDTIRKADGTALGTWVWGDLSGPAYSKRQVWDASEQYMMLQEMGGAVGGGIALVLDSTYHPVGRAGPANSYAWHPSTPGLLVGVQASGGSVVTEQFNVSGSWTTVYSTSAYSNAALGGGEGNPSNDGQYWPVMATRNSDSHTVVYVVDIVNGTKVVEIDATAAGFSPLDWGGVSQSGTYVFLFGYINNVWGRAKVYSRSTGSLVQDFTTNLMGHSDLGLDANGDDVQFGGSSASGNPFAKRRLSDGTFTNLTPSTTTNWHVSTRNIDRSGWGMAVTNNTTSYALSEEMYFVKYDGSGASSTAGSVERFGRHRSNITDYDAHPFPVPDRDGNRIVFRSNWGEASGRPVHAFVAECPF